MNATQLLAHFDRLAEASDAVPRLRRLILDLAVRGTLVEQDKTEEPAASVLKRIQTAKVKRVKSGELRSPRDLEFSDDEGNPYVLPLTWQWVRLADIGAIIGGGTPPSGDSENFTRGGEGIGWLTPADLGKHKGLFISHGARDLTVTGMAAGSATLMPKGSVLFTSRAPIGYVAIAANEISTNQGFKSVVPYLPECSRYIAIYLQAFTPWVDSRATGTTFKEVSGKIVSGLPFPLAPIAEQHRIVAKVDELMALCDQLEAAQQERERRRDRLAAASLQRLDQPAADTTPEAQREYARFYLHHLPRLTTRPEHIKAMRQTILNCAVAGRLVSQHASDESAFDLKNRIAEEKKRLLVTRGAKTKPSITEDEKFVAFDLPRGWSWQQLDQLAWKITDGDHLTPQRESSGRFLLSARNVLNGRLDLSDVDYVGDAEFQRMRSRCDPEKFDVLISCSGSIGRVAIVDKDDAYVLVRSAALVKLVFAQDIAPYIAKALLSDHLQAQMVVRSKAAAQPNLFIGSIRQLMIPIPPLTEQHRIVAKVDELMALCDQLEAQLSITQTDSRRLLEAVLEAALTA